MTLATTRVLRLVALSLWAVFATQARDALPGLRQLMDAPLRDTSICRGPDGAWYLSCQFKLKALYMRVAGDADAYRQQGEPWLKAYASSARSLADHLNETNRDKLFSQPIPETWVPDVLRDLAQAVDAWLKQQWALGA